MHQNRSTASLWTVLLLAIGFAANRYLACGADLVAFALVAVLTLGLRRGSLVALGIWLESQILGFAVFEYPHAPMTVAWGVALGAATLLAAAAGNACASRGSIIAFAAAFAAYEAGLAAFALASGSGFQAFTPAIVGQLAVSNAALAFAGLVLERVVAVAEAGIISAFSRQRNT
jgi:hypothetical protein